MTPIELRDKFLDKVSQDIEFRVQEFGIGEAGEHFVNFIWGRYRFKVQFADGGNWILLSCGNVYEDIVEIVKPVNNGDIEQIIESVKQYRIRRVRVVRDVLPTNK